MFSWNKKVVGGQVYREITAFYGRFRKVIPVATTNWFFPALTVFFSLLVFLFLGVDAFLNEVLDMPRKQRDDLLAVPGGLSGLLAIGSGWAWRREVLDNRRVLREHEEKMRDQAERRKAVEEKNRIEEEERRRADEELRTAKAEREKREERERLRIESLLRRDAVRDEINYMSGVEFEKFMADLFFRQKGYAVEGTPASGDQGIDLILPDLDGKRVAVQLKRWSGPVGNAVVGATFAGMAHYEADEGWIITTSTFTPKARELARSTRVRLIDGKELAEWLEGLREQEQ